MSDSRPPRILAWNGWGAFRDDTSELISAHPGKAAGFYEAKHAAMGYEHEHGVPCSWNPVKVVLR